MSDITTYTALRPNKLHVNWEYGTPLRGITPITIDRYREIEKTLDTILDSLNNYHKTSTLSHGTVTTQNSGFATKDQITKLDSLVQTIDYVLLRVMSKVSPNNFVIASEIDYTELPSGWKLCNGENTTPNILHKKVLGTSNSSTYPDSSFTETEHGNDVKDLSVLVNFVCRKAEYNE